MYGKIRKIKLRRSLRAHLFLSGAWCIRNLCRKFNNFCFLLQNHQRAQISIILPDTKELPSTVLPLLQDTDHYQIDELPLTEFIKKPFIEGFIKNGMYHGVRCPVLHTKFRLKIKSQVKLKQFVIFRTIL